MNKRQVLVAFNGDPMCFVHVLLNALDMEEKGLEVKVVIEGSATKTVNGLAGEGKPFSELYSDEMKGHPSLAKSMEQGYEVISF